ncbi:MAG: TonB-dependent receptor [Flavobacteriales bacterium]|jgi:outer membrane receptor for ferrienterochelin and colicin|nr:TonB-dependent receptor [Flavobacteriales bacterium]
MFFFRKHIINSALIGAFVLLINFAFSQKVTINGYIEDSESGEKLIGATVFDAKTLLGTTTNVYGFYSLTLPADSIIFTASFVGFKPIVFKLDGKKDTTINVSLSSSLDLQEVEIIASQSENIEERTQMSTIEIPMRQIEKLPALMGEIDVLKAIQLLPGVQSGGEGTSGFYVRGGGPDQNLILLDGVPVYNASHLFGFFSVFNSDAINSVTLVKGGFPARYGGRLSSVLDIRMKEGNSKKIVGSASVGLISSKLRLEGPIFKDKTSFIVSGRRTYIDAIAKPFIKAYNDREKGKEGYENREENTFDAGYYFYDLNAKVNHKFNDKHRLFLSAYLGNDKAYITDNSNYSLDNDPNQYRDNIESSLKWGNITTALRWNSIINKKLFANTTFTYSQYKFNVGLNFESFRNDTSTSAFGFEYLSGIYDVGGKVDFDYLPNPNHYVKFGLGETYHTFTPGVQTIQMTDGSTSVIDTSVGSSKIYPHEFYAYLEDDIKIGALIKVNPGVHFSGFYVNEKLYKSLQPRLSANYMFRENWSFKASLATMTQYIHLLTNGTVGLPTDLWVPVTDSIPPMQSVQYAAGLTHTFRDKYEISIEGYYKTMKNVIEYKEGASFFDSNEEWDQKVEVGNGWSYGGELFIQRKMGKLTGWFGYTLSWTNRRFDNLNFGETFPYKYDRRHDISVAFSYDIKENISLGITWVYGTGNAISLPIGSYQGFGDNFNPYDVGKGDDFRGLSFGGYGINYYESRNSWRMPSYHRLDIGANFTKEKTYWTRTWTFGFYNVYNRQNPFFVDLGYNDQGDRALMQTSLFPIIPSFAYKVDF